MSDTRKMLAVGFLIALALIILNLVQESSALSSGAEGITGAVVFNPNFYGIIGTMQNPPIILDVLLFFTLFLSVCWLGLQKTFPGKEQRGALIMLCVTISLIMTIGLVFNPVWPVSIADLGIFIIIFLILIALLLIYSLVLKVLGGQKKVLSLLIAIILLAILYLLYMIWKNGWNASLGWQSAFSFGLTGGFGTLDWLKYLLVLVALVLAFWGLFELARTILGKDQHGKTRDLAAALIALALLGLLYLIYLLATNQWSFSTSFGGFNGGYGLWNSLKSLFTGTNLWLGLPVILALLTIIFWMMLENFLGETPYKIVIALLIALLIGMFGLFIATGGDLSKIGIGSGKITGTPEKVIAETGAGGTEELEVCSEFADLVCGNYKYAELDSAGQCICAEPPKTVVEVAPLAASLLSLKQEQNVAWKTSFGEKPVDYSNDAAWEQCGDKCSKNQEGINKILADSGLHAGPIEESEALALTGIFKECQAKGTCESEVTAWENARIIRLKNDDNTKNLPEVKNMPASGWKYAGVSAAGQEPKKEGGEIIPPVGEEPTTAKPPISLAKQTSAWSKFISTDKLFGGGGIGLLIVILLIAVFAGKKESKGTAAVKSALLSEEKIREKLEELKNKLSPILSRQVPGQLMNADDKKAIDEIIKELDDLAKIHAAAPEYDGKVLSEVREAWRQAKGI